MLYFLELKEQQFIKLLYLKQRFIEVEPLLDFVIQ